MPCHRTHPEFSWRRGNWSGKALIIRRSTPWCWRCPYRGRERYSNMPVACIESMPARPMCASSILWTRVIRHCCECGTSVKTATGLWDIEWGSRQTTDDYYTRNHTRFLCVVLLSSKRGPRLLAAQVQSYLAHSGKFWLNSVPSGLGVLGRRYSLGGFIGAFRFPGRLGAFKRSGTLSATSTNDDGVESADVVGSSSDVL